MATEKQRQDFARETIENARRMRHTYYGMLAIDNRYKALGLGVEAFQASDFAGESELEHLTPQLLVDVIVTFRALFTALENGNLDNLDQVIP